MNLFHMAWRYGWSRPAVTALTVAGIALGAGLVTGVLTLRQEVDRLFLRDSSLYDVVVGAKGSPLQLVLSAVYHIDVPPGNIPLAMLGDIEAKSSVETVIPLSLGDNVEGFRIVGVGDQLLNLTDRRTGESVVGLAEGIWMNEPFDAVVGSGVAAELGLNIGDRFVGTHGLIASPGAEPHGDHPYTVTGLLEPSGTALDQVVLTPLASVWLVHEDPEAVHARMDQDREVTALLVRMKAPGLRLWLADEIQRETPATAAIPLREMLRLQQRLIRPLTRILLVIAVAVVATAFLSICISMMLTAERRRRDWTILRHLGARPVQVLGLLALEVFSVVSVGVLLGWILSYGVLRLLVQQIPFSIAEGLFRAMLEPSLGAVLLGLVLVGTLAGLIPAWLAYRKDPELRRE